MPQDAFTIRYIAGELKEALTGGKISRIIQPAKDELTFIIYTGKGNVKLDACLSAQSSRLSLNEEDKPVPLTAPNFCMLLRKHLQNAKILDVVQPDFERIIYFDLMCVSDFSSSVMRLYFEIMGKYSNAILCENGTILGALKTTSIGENTRRVLFGGVKYSPPEPQDKVSPEDKKGMNSVLVYPSPDCAKQICEKVKGIAYSTALEIAGQYGEPSGEDIYSYVFGQPADPCVIYSGNEPCDFAVRSINANVKKYPSVLSAQSAFYTFRYKKKAFAGAKTKLLTALNSAIKKAEKRLENISGKLNECRDSEKIKLYGELITANIYRLERGMKSFSAVNYYDPEQREITIPLDVTLTPSQNSQKYYKRYAKLKRTQESATAQLSETQTKLDYYFSILSSINSAENITDLAEIEEELISLALLKSDSRDNKKKKQQSFPYRTYVFEGFTILAGRNNLQNERLTKSLSPDDIWLHTQKYHSSHVAVISGGKKVPDSVIKTASEICAYYSDAREGSKIPVDYTFKKYVKKPPRCNAGFVIYTDYKTALAQPCAHTESGDKNEF